VGTLRFLRLEQIALFISEVIITSLTVPAGPTGINDAGNVVGIYSSRVGFAGGYRYSGSASKPQWRKLSQHFRDCRMRNREVI